LFKLDGFLEWTDGKVRVATPRILSIDPGGRFVVEKRLPGTSLLRRLPKLKGEPRRTALTRFVAGAEFASRFSLPEPPYGHVLASGPLHADSWTGFLQASLDRAIARNRATIAGEVGNVDALRAAALALLPAVPDRPPKTLIHGDYFPGNVLMDDSLEVSGLVDFSEYTLIGDPGYDILTAPIFLEMIDEADADDVLLAEHTARTRYRGDARAAAFYRAHAAFVMADPGYGLPPYPRLYPWAIANLKQLAEGEID
jgi:hypothetical protein